MGDKADKQQGDKKESVSKDNKNFVQRQSDL